MTTSPSTTPRPSFSTPNSVSENGSAGPVADGLSNQISTAPSSSSTATPPLGLPRALKPIGIVNEQNTCFLNSTFQALSATAPLISLLNSTPEGPLIPAPISSLPPPAIDAKRIPSLIPEVLEPPLYPLLPVTRTFLTSLQKSWKMKDGGGGTSGPGETSSSRSMRLHHLLREMARKYDQYDDYMQQDAHELLRHLLDSMEMEEKDVIKKVQPQAYHPKKRKSHNREMISPLPSPLPSPAPSAPGSPTKVTFMETAGPGSPDKSRSGSLTSIGAAATPVKELPEDERMVPFVDVLFGGLLASVVVCEHCKSVSHTYEGFLDISLSLKGDAPRPRKRDRLKAAFGLKPRTSLSKQSGNEPQSTGGAHSGHLSESELSDSERRPSKDTDRRRSMDQEDRPIIDDASDLKRNSSTSVFGIKGRPSFSFGKKKQTKPITSNSSSSLVDPDKTPPAPSVPGSPNTFSRHHGPGPTPAQSAYIQRILSGPQMTHGHEDPLAKLRAANSGEGITVPVNTDTGLEESLKHFTSVEVLEGDNAFACRKCYKIKSGRYKNGHATVPEEDEGVDGLGVSPLLSKKVVPPSISIVGSDSGSERALSINDDYGRTGRTSSIASRSSAASNARAPSPLRRLVEEGDEQSALEKSYAASAVSTESGIIADPEEYASDGLSDSSSSEDEPPPSTLPAGHRPKMAKRRKSSHFVMRRAFKRYLIAKAPEVLVFHFKRFKQTQKSGLTFTSFYDLKKMDDFVSFPETFDLAPYLAPNRNDYKLHPTVSGPRAPYMDWQSPEHGPEALSPVMYRLYALVVHLGSMIGGHYIAYVLVDPEVMFHGGAVPSGVQGDISNDLDQLSLEKKSEKSVPNSRATSPNSSKRSLPAPDGAKKDRRVWCYCSDTSIRLASVEEVLAAKAYICFYEKVTI